MKKKIVIATLITCLTASSGTIYANTNENNNTSPLESVNLMEATVGEESTNIVEVVSISTVTAKENDNVDEQTEEIILTEEMFELAGILPDSPFYGLKRALEKLQIAILRNEEKLAELKAKHAIKRAAEAAVMINKGQEDLGKKATEEYIKALASATVHMNSAIEAKDRAVEKLESLKEAYEMNRQIMNSVIENAPEDIKVVIENTLAEQGKTLDAVNGFYVAKGLFFEAKEQLKEAKDELKLARKNGDAEEIRIAEEKVRSAEALKDELEDVKDKAEIAKEEVDKLVEQANQIIKIGLEHNEKVSEALSKEEKKSDGEIKKGKEKEKSLEQAEKKLEKKEQIAEKKINKIEEKINKIEDKMNKEASKSKN